MFMLDLDDVIHVAFHLRFSFCDGPSARAGARGSRPPRGALTAKEALPRAR